MLLLMTGVTISVTVLCNYGSFLSNFYPMLLLMTGVTISVTVIFDNEPHVTFSNCSNVSASELTSYDVLSYVSLQCFHAVGWVTGRASDL